MKYLITILAVAICSIGASGTGIDQAQAQQTVLTTDPNLPIPKLSFDTNGDLKITASSTSSPSDFDFLVGKWKMHNRRLNRVASNVGVLDPPVVGSFENNVGHFFCKDTFNGKPIIMMFRWDARDPDRPVWSQAFSPDNGKTWEWNWYNVSERIR